MRTQIVCVVLLLLPASSAVAQNYYAPQVEGPTLAPPYAVPQIVPGAPGDCGPCKRPDAHPGPSITVREKSVGIFCLDILTWRVTTVEGRGYRYQVETGPLGGRHTKLLLSTGAGR